MCFSGLEKFPDNVTKFVGNGFKELGGWKIENICRQYKGVAELLPLFFFIIFAKTDKNYSIAVYVY
ncbi:hypothetical protein [Metaclostridioides mangenotii]|uniref:Uncharacterized protein n=2 Tax=Metaclostridioides mangenotii TaxID=1540 RepID=A0ABS4EAU4_9FIRM|nr:hypothetical protein [Clostridioides mangenotii]